MPVSPLKEYTKISDLPRKQVKENDKIPINTKDSKTAQTSVIAFSDIREGVFFDTAPSTIEAGLLTVDNGEMFFVYENAAKFAVLQYLKVNDAASPVIGLDGNQRRYPTYMSLQAGIELPRETGYGQIGMVTSFDRLRSIKPAYTGQRVMLSSYTAGGTIGGGEFVGRIGNKPDNGGTIASDGSSFYWERVATQYTLEDFGGGEGETDSVDAMRRAQAAGVGPIALAPGKTYYYSNSVRHFTGGGWLGNGATIKFKGVGNKRPFITSLKTAAGVNNDLNNGTSGVKGLLINNLTIDVSYTDKTGTEGFEHAENTLDLWTDCIFENVTFKNGKFDTLGLQNKSVFNQFNNCSFIDAGEDSVTIRGSCDYNSFIQCNVINSALVAHRDGTFYGDGIVNKGRNTLIKNCRFINIGNGIKGAGIANNAEDTKNADEASYGTYIGNYFLNCYGGFGFGTVNPAFISEGDLIKGVKAVGNVFENTLRTAVSIRDLKEPVLFDNVIVGQLTGNVTAVEITRCGNFQLTGRVTEAMGPALIMDTSSGTIDLVGQSVSTTKTLNAVTITKSNRVTGSIKVVGSKRRGVIITDCNNLDLDLYVDAPEKDAVELNMLRYSDINVKMVNVPENGLTVINSVESNIRFNASDIGTLTSGTYYPIKLTGVRNCSLSGTSSTSATNKPLYDITSDGACINLLIANSRLSAGEVGKVQVGSGSTITQANII